jgi:hypothetical protein
MFNLQEVKFPLPAVLVALSRLKVSAVPSSVIPALLFPTTASSLFYGVMGEVIVENATMTECFGSEIPKSSKSAPSHWEPL